MKEAFFRIWDWFLSHPKTSIGVLLLIGYSFYYTPGENNDVFDYLIMVFVILLGISLLLNLLGPLKEHGGPILALGWIYKKYILIVFGLGLASWGIYDFTIDEDNIDQEQSALNWGCEPVGYENKRLASKFPKEFWQTQENLLTAKLEETNSLIQSMEYDYRTLLERDESPLSKKLNEIKNSLEKDRIDFEEKMEEIERMSFIDSFNDEVPDYRINFLVRVREDRLRVEKKIDRLKGIFEEELAELEREYRLVSYYLARRQEALNSKVYIEKCINHIESLTY